MRRDALAFFFLATLGASGAACMMQPNAAPAATESDVTDGDDDDDDDDDDIAEPASKETSEAPATSDAGAAPAIDAAPAGAITTWTATIPATDKALFGAPQTLADGTVVNICFGVRYENATLEVKTNAAGQVTSVTFDGKLSQLRDARCTNNQPPSAPASYAFETAAPADGVITATGAATNSPPTSFKGELRPVSDDTALFATDIARTDAPAPNDWKMHLQIILTKKGTE